MRTKKFDRCTTNEMEEDIRKELKKMREDFMELQQQVADNTQDIHRINTRHIPLHIHSKLSSRFNKNYVFVSSLFSLGGWGGGVILTA